MKKILRLDLLVTTLILCVSFLLCGIVEINDKTSYVISGRPSEVFRSQKLDGDPVFSLEKGESGSENGSTFLSIDFSGVEKVAGIAKYCVFPPIGAIIAFVEETTEK